MGGRIADPSAFIESFEKEFDNILLRHVNETEGTLFDSLQRLKLQSLEGFVPVQDVDCVSVGQKPVSRDRRQSSNRRQSERTPTNIIDDDIVSKS